MSVVSNFSRLLKVPSETEEFAASLARLCKIGDVLLLYGEVGAGKTTFARGFIETIAGMQEEIVSPTFTLVQTYPFSDDGTVWHYDLYRLQNVAELVELGFEEAIERGIVLVEWPEIARHILPETSLYINLSIEGDGRKAIVAGDVVAWGERLKNL